MRSVYVAMIAALSCMAPSAAIEAPAAEREPFRLIVGQDLGALRGYYGSGQFDEPHGVTIYLSLMNLLNPDADYGGLGIDDQDRPLAIETDWGGGPTSAWIAVNEFDPEALAIGLNFADYAGDGLIDRLVAGELDANINQLADFLIMIDRTAYVRVGYEFDGAWNPGYEDTARYVAAYQRIVDIIRARGAEKAQFVWQHSTSPIDDIIDGHRDDPMAWYPGDAYVDWVGVSWFLPPDQPQTSQVAPHLISWTQRELVMTMLDIARGRGKPVMIAEASPQGFDLQALTRSNISPILDGPPGQAARSLTPEEVWEIWYGPLFAFIDEHEDVVRALAYIDVRWDDQDLWDAPYEGGYWGDSRIELHADLVARWNAATRRLTEN